MVDRAPDLTTGTVARQEEAARLAVAVEATRRDTIATTLAAVEVQLQRAGWSRWDTELLRAVVESDLGVGR